MNADRLLAHYERVADAPDAIPRLRRFILDLAVRGKLVPQDPNDEPASELLKRIATEKARLAKAGEIRKPKAIPVLPKPPLPIPANWHWSQIAEIGVLSPRNEAPDTLEASFVPMPLIAAEYGVANQHEIRPWGEIKKGYTHFAEGDVGLAKITPCFENGKSTVFRNLTGGIGSGTTELHIVRPLFVDQNYILLFLKSPHFIETGIPKMTGTAGQKRVPTEYFAHSPFPLPPLAEQNRIITKVDELMALCDRLETARASREAVRDRLAAASFAHLNAPDPETFHNDARSTLDALPALTARPDQIKQLRQTILNLAVRGKLVPQDPTEGSAARLMNRTLPPEAGPYPLPTSWAWVRIGEQLELLNGMAFKPTDWTTSGLRIVRIQNLNNPSALFNHCRPEFARERSLIDDGAFLISWSGTPGTSFGAFIWDRGPAVLNQHIFRCEFKTNAFFARYLQIAINGRLDEMIAKAHGGVGLQHITKGKLEALPIALPPIAEQHRIVAKADELSELCNRLEISLSTGEKIQSYLLDALIADASAPTKEVLIDALA